jgi:hypothetical protein
VRVKLYVNARVVKQGETGKGTVYLWAKRA